MVMNDMTDDGKWGAAIEVNGVRPGYVSDDDMVEYTYGVPRGDGCRASYWSWDGDGRYYLKADHPHYQQTQTQTQTLTAQERLEKYEGLLRRLAQDDKPGVNYVAQMEPLRAEARALVAEMEPVVDGGVLIAREMRLEELGEHSSEGYKGFMNGGHYDNDDDVQKFVRAIRRGRELARGDVA